MAAYLHPSMRTRKRLPAINEERLARRREKDTCEPHAERLRQRRCDGILREDGLTYRHQLCPERQLFARSYRCDASHVQTKGAGGKWFEQVSHCRACHQEFEDLPKSLRRLMLPLAHQLAWESHREKPDEVPVPPVPDVCAGSGRRRGDPMKTAEIIEQLADCLAEDVATDATSDLPDSLYSTKPWPEKTHRWCLAMMRAKFHGEFDTVQALQESGYLPLALAEKTLPKDPRGVLEAAWRRHCKALGLRGVSEGGAA